MTHLQSSPPRAARRTGSFLLLALALMTLQFSVAVPGALAAPKPKPKVSNINLVPTINSIQLQNGQLVASGFVTAIIKGTTTTAPFTAPVNISLAPDQTGAGACPILDLELGPINLNLLGLVVETSPICLTITAYEGGGLLGELLCAIANLLQARTPLDQILNGLTSTQVATLTSSTQGLPALFNGALAELIRAVLTAINPGGACGILHLELGPVDLTLLGLNVHLDDCEGGPVVVDITAQPGPGAVLGNLLCELLDGGLLGGGLTLGQILDRILALLNQ